MNKSRRAQKQVQKFIPFEDPESAVFPGAQRPPAYRKTQQLCHGCLRENVGWQPNMLWPGHNHRRAGRLISSPMAERQPWSEKRFRCRRPKDGEAESRETDTSACRFRAGFPGPRTPLTLRRPAALHLQIQHPVHKSERERLPARNVVSFGPSKD
jgi:hypothetical protein